MVKKGLSYQGELLLDFDETSVDSLCLVEKLPPFLINVFHQCQLILTHRDLVHFQSAITLLQIPSKDLNG